MSVFPFPNVVPNSSAWSLRANTAVFRSPLSGAIQTKDRGGEHWAAVLTLHGLRTKERALLQSLLTRLNGQQHRVAVGDHAYTKRGVLVVTELMNDPDFEDVLNKWASGVSFEIFAVDEGLRAHQIAIGVSNVRQKDPATITTIVGRSYSLAVDFLNGFRPSVSNKFEILVGTTNGGDEIFSLVGATDEDSERLVGAATAPTVATFVSLRRNTSDFDLIYDVSRVSFARCLLVDNGYNTLQRSNEFDNADWTKTNSSITANQAGAYDKSATADELIENSTAGVERFVLQNGTRVSAQEYWTASVDVRANTSQRIMLRILGGGGENGARVKFDALTGVITEAAQATGTGTNAYATMHLVETGLYRCRLSVRLAAGTALSFIVNLLDGATNTIVFDGDGSSSLYLSDAQMQLGGQMGRRIRTTAPGVLGTSQTGPEIFVKGLDDNTNAQLKVGDLMEIGGQLLMLTADVDGDAIGTAIARVRPRIRAAPADEAPVVLHRPRGRFLLRDPTSGWSNVPGVFSALSLDLVEDVLG